MSDYEIFEALADKMGLWAQFTDSVDLWTTSARPMNAPARRRPRPSRSSGKRAMPCNQPP